MASEGGGLSRGSTQRWRVFVGFGMRFGEMEGWSARETLYRCWASGVISRKTLSRGPVLAGWLSRPQLHGVNAASRRRANFFDRADGPKRLEEIATLRLAKKGPLPSWQRFHKGAVPQNHIPVEKCNAPHRFLQDQTCASSLTDEASTTKLPKIVHDSSALITTSHIRIPRTKYFIMDVSDITPELEQLDVDLDKLQEALQPLLGDVGDISSKLPLLDKAKLYVLVSYALESIIFCEPPLVPST